MTQVPAVLDHEPQELDEVKRSAALKEFCQRRMVHFDARHRPLATHENIKILLDTKGIVARYNIMKKEIEIIIPDVQFTTDNYTNASSAWIMSLMRQVEMSTANYLDMLGLLAESHLYNPIEQWITSKPWDGESRLHEIFATIEPAHPEDMPFIEVAISKWMLGAVEAICNPRGADAPGILVLQGPQKIGKTWWVRKLVPDGVIEGAVKIGVSIDPSNKDSIEQCVAHWIVEFGELDGIFRKADIAALKSFLTRPQDTFRKSYAPRKSEYPRRTAFVANVNELHYLVDDTGNRRFWTISCRKINSYHEIDMQQLWAEIHYKRMVEKMPYTLNDVEELLLTAINERHQAIEPIHEMVAVRYNWESDKKYWRFITATEIAQELGYPRPEAKEVRKVGTYVRKLNGGEGKRGGGKDLLFIPPLTNKGDF